MSVPVVDQPEPPGWRSRQGVASDGIVGGSRCSVGLWLQVMSREVPALGCPCQAGLKAGYSKLYLDMGSWAGPACVVEIQKGMEREEASCCFSYCFEGCWWGMWAALGVVSLGKGFFWVEYPAWNFVSQVLNLVGAKPREIPKDAAERDRVSSEIRRKGRKPQENFLVEISIPDNTSLPSTVSLAEFCADKHLGQTEGQWDTGACLSARMGFVWGFWAHNPCAAPWWGFPARN